MNSSVCILILAIVFMVVQQSKAEGKSVLFNSLNEIGEEFSKTQTKVNGILEKLTEDLKSKAIDYKEPLKKLNRQIIKTNNRLGKIWLLWDMFIEDIKGSYKNFVETLD